MKHSEVWLVDFAPKIGQEIDKIRPAIIVNHDSIGTLQLKVVIPVTSAVSTTAEWHVRLKSTAQNGLTKPSTADCFQIKSISNQRFLKRLGRLSEKEMNDVKLGLVKVLDLV